MVKTQRFKEKLLPFLFARQQTASKMKIEEMKQSELLQRIATHTHIKVMHLFAFPAILISSAAAACINGSNSKGITVTTLSLSQGLGIGEDGTALPIGSGLVGQEKVAFNERPI